MIKSLLPKRARTFLESAAQNAGFTMIELLIVISILGILAVAVLSAINPVEQINRGRDTGTRSDVEQLLSAIDRFNAFQGYFPWQDGRNDDAGRAIDPLIPVTDAEPTVTLSSDSTVCPTLDRLTIGLAGTDCVGSQELKESFTDRITNTNQSRAMYIYNQGNQGDSTYVCFVPQSGAFLTEARDRCADGLPSDLNPIVGEICDTARSVITETGEAICLP